MPPELLNITELTKIITATAPEPLHGPLLAALNDRYPRTPFRLLQESDGRTWSVGIVDQAGNRITDKLGMWIDEELTLAGGSAEAVWRKYKDQGLMRPERAGSVLYLVAPYGPDPDQFYQLQILVGPEIAEKKLFRTDMLWPEFPEDRADLVQGWSLMEEVLVLSPPAYQFDNLINMRKFLRDLVESKRLNRLEKLPEMEKKIVHVQEIVPGADGWSESYDVPFLELSPNWLDRIPPELRLFQDWQESSAGQGGARICDHWWMQVGEWADGQGRKQYSLVPQWAEADGGLSLPEISPDWEASPYGVMESLQQFDLRVGYPFAWYFYMLHGNRITHSAGGVIANAIKDGLLNLPECDENVLLRWREDQYGF